MKAAAAFDRRMYVLQAEAPPAMPTAIDAPLFEPQEPAFSFKATTSQRESAAFDLAFEEQQWRSDGLLADD